MSEATNRVLVTGAAGFIGSHVCRALLARGDGVVGVDNFDPFYARSIKDANLESIRADGTDGRGGRFVFRELDICDQDGLTALMRDEGVTSVIHLAAKAGVRPSIADPVGYARANVMGTQSVLSSATDAGCDRVVCASSSSVYGNNEKTPFGEDDPVEHPISPYAATKRACELMSETHHTLTGLPIANVRFFTVFGPGQRPDLAIALFLRKIAAGEPIRMFGDGSTSRDYTMIDDIVAGVLAAHERIVDHGCRIWNLGGDHPITLRELIGTISDVVGKDAIIEQVETQPGDVERTWADLTRSRAELGYSPSTPIRAGIEAQWRAYRSAPGGVG